MKKIAFPIVTARYQLPLGDHEMPDFGHNSQDIITLGARKVETLLLDDFYVRDGIDAQVRLSRYCLIILKLIL